MVYDLRAKKVNRIFRGHFWFNRGKKTKPANHDLGAALTSRISFRALEPRTVFDGAAVATATDASTDTQATTTTEAPVDAAPATDSSTDLLNALSTSAAPASNSVVFVDTTVADYQTLVANAPENADVVLLDPGQDSLQQMADYLAGRSGIESIHILSHGDEGELIIGNTMLTNATLADHTSQLTAIGNALAENGDILLYGCNIAANTDGTAFIDTLAQLTGADVAASTDITGAGGNWMLEGVSGTVETTAFAVDTYAYALTYDPPVPAPVLDLDTRDESASTAAMWYHDNSDASASLFNTSVISSGSAVSTGITDYTYVDNTIYFNSILGSDAHEAHVYNDYVQYTFTTSAYLDENTYVAGFNVGSGGWYPTSYQYEILINTGAAADLATSTVLAQDQTLTRQGWGYSAIDTANFALSANTTYTVSVYFYNAVNNSVDWDNFGIRTAVGTPDYHTDYTEGGSAVAVASQYVNIEKADNSYIDGATVTIANAETGDQLLVNGSSAASGTLASGISWTRTDTTVTLSGNYTLADYKAALQLVQYQSTSTDPSAGQRVITTTVSSYQDPLHPELGSVTSDVATTYVDVIPVPDAVPMVDLNGDPAVSIAVSDGGAFSQEWTLAGVDRTSSLTFDLSGDVLPNTASATISFATIDNSFRVLVNGDSICSTQFETNDGDIQANDIVLRFADGTTTVAPWEANINGLPRIEVRITEHGVEFWGTRSSTSATLEQLSPVGGTMYFPDFVAGTNTISIVNLDDNNIEGMSGTLSVTVQSANYTTTYTENGPAVSIADADVAITGVDSATINGLLVKLTNPQSGDRLLVNGSTASSGTLASGISWTLSPNYYIVLSGTYSTADYAAALALITFENTSDTPSTTPRVIYTSVASPDGILTSNTAVTTINIDRAPDAVADSFTTAEDTSVIIDVLANDSDADSNSLTVTHIDGQAVALGETITLTDGTGTATLNSFGITFTPAADYNGAVSFTYAVSDGTASTTGTVSGTVTPVNDAPVAVADSFTTAEDTSITINVLANDTDVDGGDLNVIMIAGQLVAVNQPIALSSGEGLVTLNADGTITFAPTANYNGPVSFTYAVGQGPGAAMSSTTVTGTVTAVNDAPVAVADSFTTAEDTSVTINVLANDTDVDGDALTITTINGIAAVVGSPITLSNGAGTATLNADGTITFIPSANYNGMAAFGYTVSDGVVTRAAEVYGTVIAVNDAPVATGDTFTIPEDKSVTISVLSNDVDADGTSLQITHINGISVSSGGSVAVYEGNAVIGTATLNSGGTITFTPVANYNGPVSFTYTAADNAASSTAIVTGTVTPVNDAPAATADSFTTAEDTGITYNVLANDSDIDGDPLHIIDAIAEYGAVTISADGSLAFTPAPGFTGIDTITYTVEDGHGGTAIATASIEVFALPQSQPEPAPEPDPAPDADTGIPAEIVGEQWVATSNGEPGAPPVTGIANTGGSANSLAVTRPVIAAVNDLYYLGGIGQGDYDGGEVAREVQRLSEVRELAAFADGLAFARGTDVAGLTGFSLKFNLYTGLSHAGDDIAGSFANFARSDAHANTPAFKTDYAPVDNVASVGATATRDAPNGEVHGDMQDTHDLVTGSNQEDVADQTAQLVVESLVRDRSLIVQLSVMHSDRAVVEYRVLQANGRPLPDWLSQGRDGLLIGHVPANIETVSLRINAVFSDGSIETREVVIRTSTGEIRPLLGERAEAPSLFADQLRASVLLSEEQVEQLARALR